MLAHAKKNKKNTFKVKSINYETVEDRESRIEWQRINKECQRENTSRAKLKTCQRRKRNTDVERTLQESVWKLPNQE